MAVRVRHLVGHTAPCLHVLPSADGARGHDLASCGEDGWIRLWDLRAAKAVRALGEPRGPSARGPRPAGCACHSPLDAHVLFAAWAEAAYAFDLRAGGVIARDATLSFTGAADALGSLAVSADGAALVGGDDSGALHAWDARSGRRQLRVEEAHTSVLSAVACHPKHALRAYSAGLDGRICAWPLPADTRGAGRRSSARGGLKPAWSCALLEEAAAGGGGAQQLYNPRLAHSVALDAAGELLAAALGDGSVELRSADSGAPVARTAEADRHADCACLAGFLADGAPEGARGRLWSAGNDRLLRVWSVEGAAKGKSGGGGKRAAGGVDAAALYPVLDIRLPHKPNWVAALRTPSPALCVADVGSGTLAVYELAG